MRFKVGDYFPDFIFNTAYRKNLQVHEILNKETVFWCIRYIGCPVCRYDVHCIKEKYAEIQKKNAQVFVVMQSDQKHIQDVIKEDELPFEIICDPEKKFYNELEIDPALSKEELIGHNTDELEKKRQACKELGYTHGDIPVGRRSQNPVRIYEGKFPVSGLWAVVRNDGRLETLESVCSL